MSQSTKPAPEKAFKLYSKTTEKFEVIRAESFILKFTYNKFLPLYEKYDQKVMGNPQYSVEYIKDIMSNLRDKEVTIFFTS